MYIELPGDHAIWNSKDGHILGYNLQHHKGHNEFDLYLTVGPDMDGYRVY